jgi:hypothetical protein
MFRTDKSIKTEDKFVVVWGNREEGFEDDCHGYRVSFWVQEIVWNWIMRRVAQPVNILHYQTVCFKVVKLHHMNYISVKN